MAHVWIKSAPSEWRPRALHGNAITLAELVNAEGVRSATGAVRGSICNLEQPGGSGLLSALMLPRGVLARVNGKQIIGGFKCLEDRDEIALAGQRFFFSTERLAAIEPYAAPSAGAAIFCPRCKQGIEDRCLIVACPQCGAKHHQTEEEDLPCWTYSARCSLCDCPTNLKGDFRWSPTAL